MNNLMPTNWSQITSLMVIFTHWQCLLVSFVYSLNHKHSGLKIWSLMRYALITIITLSDHYSVYCWSLYWKELISMKLHQYLMTPWINHWCYSIWSPKIHAVITEWTSENDQWVLCMCSLICSYWSLILYLLITRYYY